MRFLVIVTRPPDMRSVSVGTAGGSYSDQRPTVKWVDAEDAEDAAQRVGVPAGSRAEVCEAAAVRTFERPLEAPLIEGDKAVRGA